MKRKVLIGTCTPRTTTMEDFLVCYLLVKVLLVTYALLRILNKPEYKFFQNLGVKKQFHILFAPRKPTLSTISLTKHPLLHISSLIHYKTQSAEYKKKCIKGMSLTMVQVLIVYYIKGKVVAFCIYATKKN